MTAESAGQAATGELSWVSRLRSLGQRPQVLGPHGAPDSAGIPLSRQWRQPAPADEAVRYAPANALACFERAVALSADIDECDVRLSADGAVVVIHDDAVDHTIDGHGSVAEQRLERLRHLDAGAWFGRARGGSALTQTSGGDLSRWE